MVDSGEPFDFYADEIPWWSPRFKEIGLSQPPINSRAMYPCFDPPLRPIASPTHPLWRWISCLFPSVSNRESLSLPFEHEGDKPQCYGLHAKVIPLERPPYDPDVVVKFIDTTDPLTDPGRVWRLDVNTVVKCSVSGAGVTVEALNMLMIRTMTSIPVPEIYEVVLGRVSCLVMQYIEGRTLDKCWSELGPLRKLRIAWTLRGYISQLRRLRRSVPGTLDGSACQGFPFSIYDAGPFASYDDMTAWFNHKLDVCQRMHKAPPDAPRFDSSWPLVFTHMDLFPRNILLADDGTLFVIDWGKSGFYPSWFEYAGMWDYTSPLSWKILVPFIAG
ncbi:hypothetical protein A0H81_03299 [Grifola frondosa]|uniref:Aminoglycoside phosphotransferase domain-containing protein n=1 Tax=Grifola frondosa TaxID=5627 RepID=A0A1C7MGQ4_GRIFR|nr:hypothetical protein A0H81_03299 [Grifola frondosa]